MGNPKSKNTKLSTVSIPNVTISRPSEKLLSKEGIVSYGADNKFPSTLYSLYAESPTHQSIIEGKVNYILGSGVDFFLDKVNKEGETVSDIINKIAIDLCIFNGFAIQVIYDGFGEIAEIYWSDFTKLRTDKSSKNIYWSDSWGSYGQDVIAYQAFDPELKGKSTQIFYYKGRGTRNVYPVPQYVAALEAINTEIQIQRYHLNNIHNNFTGSTIMNFNNGVPEEADRIEMEEKINEKFSGADNAGKILMCWNEDKEKGTTVERLDSGFFDSQFARLSKDTQRSIFVSHRVTSPCLFGIVSENTGFSKTEYKESFEVFNLTVISPLQKEIERAFNRIFGETLTIKPFEL